MAGESISFLAYFLGRLVAGAVAVDNALLIKQGDAIRRIEFSVLSAAMLAESFVAPSAAGAVAVDNALLIKQGDVICRISVDALAEALAIESGNGSPVTIAVESTFTAGQGLILLNPPEGVTVRYHLPIYGTVSGRKRYKVKNIGQGLAEFDAVDGKTVDDQLFQPLAPGDRCEIGKDGINWQTF